MSKRSNEKTKELQIQVAEAERDLQNLAEEGEEGDVLLYKETLLVQYQRVKERLLSILEKNS